MKNPISNILLPLIAAVLIIFGFTALVVGEVDYDIDRIDVSVPTESGP